MIRNMRLIQTGISCGVSSGGDPDVLSRFVITGFNSVRSLSQASEDILMILKL